MMEVPNTTGDETVIERPNAYIVVDEGETKTVSKDSSLNKLVYGHGLHGFLVKKEEIWHKDGITLVPHEDGDITLQPDEGEELRINSSHRGEIVELLEKVFEKDDATVLMDLYHEIRADMVRQDVLEPFAETFPVNETERGWRIGPRYNLLLTWEVEFYYPDHRTRDRRGNIMGDGLQHPAYQHQSDELPTARLLGKKVEVGGKTRMITEGESEFLVLAMWAIERGT